LQLLQNTVYSFDIDMDEGHKKATEEVLSWIPENCMDILDVGCGNGWTVRCHAFL